MTLCVLCTEHGHGTNDVCAAILGQGSWDDFQGCSDLAIRQLSDTLDVVGLLLQLVAYFHLDSASTGNQERVETDVSSNVDSILRQTGGKRLKSVES